MTRIWFIVLSCSGTQRPLLPGSPKRPKLVADIASSTWHWVCKNIGCWSYGVMKASTELSKEGPGGQAKWSRAGVPVGSS